LSRQPPDQLQPYFFFQPNKMMLKQLLMLH
jgi:hypothetical protein